VSFAVICAISCAIAFYFNIKLSDNKSLSLPVQQLIRGNSQVFTRQG
jgi:hypothetical protein